MRGFARRVRHHAALPLAAALAVLPAATALAALASVGQRASETSLRERVDRLGASVRISGRYDGDRAREADDTVRTALRGIFAEVPARTTGALRSPAARSAQLTVLGRDDATFVAVVALQDVAEHGRLTEGRWPRADARGAVETALPAELATRNGLTPGSEFEVATGPEGTDRVRLRVTGAYLPAEDSPAVWKGLRGAIGGSDQIALVTRRDLVGRAGFAADALAVWTAVPDARRMPRDAVGPLLERTGGLSAGDPELAVFGGRAPPLADMEADTDLPFALRGLRTPQAVGDASMYVPGALLAALAAATLVLTARQLLARQAGESALRQARGAGTPRVLAGTAAQAAVAAVPAAAAAPLLAGPLLTALHRAGLLDARLLPDGPTRAGAAAALLAAGTYAAAVLVPALRQARDARAATGRRRGARLAAFQRGGTDVALGLLALLAWLRLRQTGAPVALTQTVAVDPVLVLAPLVMTGAAALLALRLLPVAARAVEPPARRARGLVLPLGGWQLGRHAARATGAALVMTLALAVGALSGTALAVLDRGDRDQAGFAVGSDLRVEDGGAYGGITRPRPELHSAYEELPGVTAAAPVTQLEGAVRDQPLGLTAHPTASGVTPWLREDLTGGRTDRLLAPLGEDVPAHGVPLPAGGGGLALPVTVSTDRAGPPGQVLVRLELLDADGLTHLTEPLAARADGRQRTLRTDARDAVRLTAVRLELPTTDRPLRERGTYRLRIGLPDGMERGAGWKDPAPGSKHPGDNGCPGVAPTRSPETTPVPVLCEGEQRDGMLAELSLRGPELSLVEVYPPQPAVRLVPDAAQPPPLPVLADAPALASGRLEEGAVRQLVLDDARTLRVRVVGALGGVPGSPRGEGRLLADSRALAAHLALSGQLPHEESFWWLAAPGGRADTAAAALRTTTGLGTPVTAREEAAALTAGPLRLGTRAVLALCLLAAPCLAVVGFTLHTALAIRARRREFALLRALGMRRGQLAAVLWTEQLALALVAALVGTAIGAVLAALVMPLVTADDRGTPVYPDLLPVVPWTDVALTTGATALLVCAVVTLAGRLLARLDLTRALRAGEDG